MFLIKFLHLHVTVGWEKWGQERTPVRVKDIAVVCNYHGYGSFSLKGLSPFFTSPSLTYSTEIFCVGSRMKNTSYLLVLYRAHLSMYYYTLTI